ncbi:DHA2 family efflux MFS transporter permease subunit [Periweissella cryptocerci]|uniref:DHA2 family efflux MFS transporter permease subunit n=1 Tax=Periweissella cryptocerci TaxID=2506420 RepID=A0A4P6YU56_9LACO|nr:DHA2 family efflux MFS transporter permease subunit [Periweissella cryptocerci]QBO36233.1 DHA2 family efflux MFS transporter permease subunit [Periweissella cryptocerci]
MNLKTRVSIVALALGTFLVMLDTTIMNIALPAIKAGLHVSLPDLSWALNIYTITFAVLMIPLGRLADISGRNKLYLLGLILFGTGSLASGLALNVPILIAARGLQAIGGAIVFPASMTIALGLVDMQSRSKILLSLGITQGLAAALGPTIGGIITTYLSWRWVFFVNVPIVLASVILIAINLPLKNESHVNGKIDWLGSLFLMITLFSLTLGLIQGNDWGWSSVRIIALFVTTVIALLTFIIYERHAASPMINFELFKNRNFNGAALTMTLVQLFLVAVMVLLPTYLTSVQGTTEFKAALLITPVSLLIFIMAPLSALLMEKIGVRVLFLIGFISLAVGYFLLWHLDVTNGYTQLIIADVVIGFGYGAIAGPITVIAASDFTGELLTASQSVIGVLRQIGSVLAVAIFVSTLTTNLTHETTKSEHYADTQISKLAIPTAAKTTMTKAVHQQLAAGKANSNNKPAISKKDEAQLVATNYQQVLKQQHLPANAPITVTAAIHAQVTKQVHATVTKINLAVAHTATSIGNHAKNNAQTAFLSLYGMALPVVIASILATFIFKGKKRNDKVSTLA